jgi:Stress responsive A/B Barrel Domain
MRWGWESHTALARYAQLAKGHCPFHSSLMYHCVYFWLKKDLSAADRQLFRDELALVTKIPYLGLAVMGQPCTEAPARPVTDKSWDWNLVLRFDSMKDHDFYQTDCQDHIRFVDTCKPLWDKVIVYDMTPAAA